MKVLVVDDEPVLIDLVTQILKKKVAQVCDRKLHYGRYRKAGPPPEEFDLLITDVVMPPGDDGTKLAAFAKDNYPDMPIIAMTAGMENAPDDYVNYADMFVDHAMAKPFKPKELLEAIEKVTAKV